MANPKPTPTHPIRMRLHVGTMPYPRLANAPPCAGSRFVPQIRLGGVWLATAGFSPADALDIEVSPGRIVITRV